MKTAVEEEERTNAVLLHTHTAFLRQSSLEELKECTEAARFPMKNNEIRVRTIVHFLMHNFSDLGVSPPLGSVVLFH